MIATGQHVLVDGLRSGTVEARQYGPLRYLILFEDEAGWYEAARVELDGQTQLEGVA